MQIRTAMAMGVALATLLSSAGCSRRPQLPEALARHECRGPDSKAGSRKDYDVYRAGSTTLFFPCVKQGEIARMEKDPIYVRSRWAFFGFSQDRTGVFHSGPRAPQDILWIFAEFFETPASPWDIQARKAHWDVEVRLPPAFTRTEMATQFSCQNPEPRRDYRSGREYPRACYGIIRSSALEWRVKIEFNQPFPDKEGLPKDIGYALEHLALHIAKQP